MTNTPAATPILTNDAFIRTFPQLEILGTDLSDIVSAFHTAGATGVVSQRLRSFVSIWAHLTAEEKHQEAAHLLRGRRSGRYPETVDLAVAWLDWGVQFHTIATRIFLEEQREAHEALHANRKWTGDDLAEIEDRLLRLMERHD